ncbi:MAG: traA, partial [Acidimicrobiales bacterium]|nr:traA [Acidimicrobiales bacterium]
ATEATAAGLEPGAAVDDLVVGRQVERVGGPSEPEIFAALVDPQTGLCATESRFCEAHVIERVAAISGGRLSTDEIVAVSTRFLGSEHVVRLAPDASRRRPPEWSTVELRCVEDRLLAKLGAMASTPAGAIATSTIDAALARERTRLGADQVEAVRVLCGAGPSVRALVAPAGFGKTTALHVAAAAQLDAGRHVIALAPAHKAVAELRNAGLDAQTIARFRMLLGDQLLAPNTTVIVDEVSQVATRDAALLLDAVAAPLGAQVWFVGDARQAQSVAAGGLAAEVERLAADGAIPAAGLRQNRRQRDPAERAALAKYRAGDVETSQTIRTEHGWEHELATPADTRQALAEATVADADRHGAEHVAVLAVSHADCEDVADRIRAIRAARGELRGPVLRGPGWGTDDRVYAAGDRVLVHANLGAERRVFNGTTATVLGVSGAGLEVLVDGGPQVFLSVEVLAGHRPDGSPNLSHAWARTIDGAQGGTWHQVHLLGTPALDRFTGYVGQSRGQLPTHTWNTRAEADHPLSLLADDRSSAEAVLDALRREEPKTFAATDDPWVLDRQLRAERDEHATVIATRPPDRREELERARARQTSATDGHDRAFENLVACQDRRVALGPVPRLRRARRDDIARADEALSAAAERFDGASFALDHARAKAGQLEAAVAGRATWDRDDAWRIARVTEIDTTLAHHWAEVTLAAVRADDPLAFGVDHLRDARRVYQRDLRQIVNGLPADRRDDLVRARADLAHHDNNLQYAERKVELARGALDEAHQRHWGRRDRHAIEGASAGVRAAEATVEQAREVCSQAEHRVTAVQRAVDKWTAAMTATTDERARLTSDIGDITGALDHTCPERVVAAVTDPTSELWHRLGPPPPTRGGLAAWCGIAQRVEAHLDRQSLATPTLVSVVDNARWIVERASRLDPTPAHQPTEDQGTWQAALEEASRVLAVERPRLAVDHGIGIEL